MIDLNEKEMELVSGGMTGRAEGKDGKGCTEHGVPTLGQFSF